MKKGGIVNAQLAYFLARLGHTDRLMVCDAGLSIPPGPDLVDLAFQFGVPSFDAVLHGLLDELVIEGATAAEEVKEQNRAVHELLGACLPDLDFVPHEELKRISSTARLVVRTGEATPFANVVLCCGVAF
ncbi:MAG: D-ribose pyranase [Rubrobacteraceae bacterium]